MNPYEQLLSPRSVEFAKHLESKVSRIRERNIPGFQEKPSNAFIESGLKDHVYRGVTQNEFDYIRQNREIKSTGAYSHESEGTSFADGDSGPAIAESTVNFGRDNPVKTGLSNYVLEVRNNDSLARDRRDGWVKSKISPNGSRIGIPDKFITRYWRFDPDGSIHEHGRAE